MPSPTMKEIKTWDRETRERFLCMETLEIYQSRIDALNEEIYLLKEINAKSKRKIKTLTTQLRRCNAGSKGSIDEFVDVKLKEVDLLNATLLDLREKLAEKCVCVSGLVKEKDAQLKIIYKLRLQLKENREEQKLLRAELERHLGHHAQRSKNHNSKHTLKDKITDTFDLEFMSDSQKSIVRLQKSLANAESRNAKLNEALKLAESKIAEQYTHTTRMLDKFQDTLKLLKIADQKRHEAESREKHLQELLNLLQVKSNNSPLNSGYKEKNQELTTDLQGTNAEKLLKAQNVLKETLDTQNELITNLEGQIDKLSIAYRKCLQENVKLKSKLSMSSTSSCCSLKSKKRELTPKTSKSRINKQNAIFGKFPYLI